MIYNPSSGGFINYKNAADLVVTTGGGTAVGVTWSDSANI